MKELFRKWNRMNRNALAAGLSVVPGVGHLYKHHYAAGFGILLVGNVLVGLVAVLMVLGTFGLSLLVVPALWMAGVAWSAYLAPDEHGHHPWLHVWDSRWREFVRKRRGKSPAEQSRLSSGL